MMLDQGSCAGAVEVRNELSKAFSLELPATLLFDYPTMGALAAHLAALAAPAAPAPAGHSAQPDMSAGLAQTAPGTAAGAEPARGSSQMSLAQVQEAVATAVRSVVGGDIAPAAPLAGGGVDSLAAVELQAELSRRAPRLPCFVPAPKLWTVLGRSMCARLLVQAA